MDARSLKKMAAGLSTIAGSLALVLGWIILLLPTSQGPTLGWSLAHALLFGGVALLVPAVLGMRRLVRTPEAANEGDAAVVLTLLGALALSSQYAIDLAVGQAASDQGHMDELFAAIRSSAGISFVFYSLGPIAFFVGLAMLVMGLPRAGVVPRWVALGIVVGMVLIGVGVFVVDSGVGIVLGFALMCVGFVLIGLRMLTGPLEDW